MASSDIVDATAFNVMVGFGDDGWVYSRGDIIGDEAAGGDAVNGDITERDVAGG